MFRKVAWLIRVALASTTLAALVIAGDNLHGAPKGTPILQSLFAKTGYPATKAQVDKGEVSYSIEINATTINIRELENGYALVWAVVKHYPKAVSPDTLEKMAVLNDHSRLGSLSAAPAKYGKPPSIVYINYVFLMRTADAEALQEYIELIATQCKDFATALPE